MKDDELFGKLVRSTKQRRREETNINYERSLVLGQLLIKEEYRILPAIVRTRI